MMKHRHPDSSWVACFGLVLVLVGGRPDPALAQNTPPDTAAATGSKALPISISITNNASVVYYTPSLFGMRDVTVCTDMLVLPRDTLRTPIQMTSTGLGNTRFSKVNRPGSPCVPGSSDNVLTLPPLQKRLQWVQVHLSTGEIKGRGNAIEGKILVLAPGHAPVEVPLKLQSAPASNFMTAVGWFLGILIPAIVATVLGYLSTKGAESVKKRLAEKATFNTYKRAAFDRIESFFNTLYPQLVKDNPKKFFKGLRDGMIADDIWQAMPAKEQAKMEKAALKALRKDDKSVITRALSRIFPQWKYAITQSPDVDDPDGE